MHLDDGAIQALLHGELSSADEHRWERHSVACPVCGPRLTAALEEEREVEEALALLDVPPPPLTSVQVRSLARAPRRRGFRGVWRAAAGVALALATAGALYALPGSPLRRWLSVAERPGPGASAAQPPAESGVAVPIGPVFTVEFEAPATGDTLTVTLADDRELDIRADRSASYRSRSDRLTVSGPPGTHYRLRVPRSAELVRVVARETLLLQVRSGTLAPRPQPDAEGELRIPLRP